jgi:hypothetical protein
MQSKTGNGYADDNTVNAQFLRTWIVGRPTGKTNGWINNEYQRYKVWIRLYNDRNQTSHLGLDDYDIPGELWDLINWAGRKCSRMLIFIAGREEVHVGSNRAGEKSKIRKKDRWGLLFKKECTVSYSEKSIVTDVFAWCYSCPPKV